MTDKQHAEHIINVINNTFKVLYMSYNNHKEGSSFKPLNYYGRIIFPKKRNEKCNKEDIRLSEQELRFIFVEQLNEYINKHKEWNVFYSVETPTVDTYSFKNEPTRKRVEEGGRSANFDLVIHNDKAERIALIEFKASNPPIKNYQKDLVKLSNEKEAGDLRYFIQLLENTETNTIDNIKNKIFPQEPKWKQNLGTKEVKHIYYSLEKGESNFSELDINIDIVMF